MNTRRVMSLGRAAVKALVVLAAVVGLFTMISWLSDAPFSQIASNAAYAQSGPEDPIAHIMYLPDDLGIFIDASDFPPAQRGLALMNAILGMEQGGEDRWQQITPILVEGTTTQLCLYYRASPR